LSADHSVMFPALVVDVRSIPTPALFAGELAARRTSCVPLRTYSTLGQLAGRRERKARVDWLMFAVKDEGN
jgi:hypothetical protein